MTQPQSALFVFVLIAVTALGPFAMQVFLPALPVIQADFGVPAAAAQLSVSMSMLSIAVSTLVCGPLSDRFGRRPVLLVGLCLFLAGAAICALAPNVEVLILGRIVQAAGGASGMVLARAIVRDVYHHDRVASTLAYITMAMVVAPMIAPAFGGVLTDSLGWRANFTAAGILGVAVLVLVLLRLAETNSRPPTYAGFSGMLLGFGRLLRLRMFCAYSLQGAFSFSVFFAFASAAPYVMVDVLGRPPTEYGFYFVSVSLSFMAGNFISARISPRVGMDRMIVIGSLLVLAGCLASVGLMAFLPWHPWELFVPAVVVAFGNGFTIPNSMAGALGSDPSAAGTASGLSGFMQMLIAAVFAQAAGSLQDGTPFPMLLCMTLAAVLAVAVFLWGLAGRRAAPVALPGQDSAD